MNENIFRHMIVCMPKRLKQLSCLSLIKEFQAVGSTCGFHVFKAIWQAALSKESMCERESHNKQDRFVKFLL